MEYNKTLHLDLKRLLVMITIFINSANFIFRNTPYSDQGFILNKPIISYINSH